MSNKICYDKIKMVIDMKKIIKWLIFVFIILSLTAVYARYIGTRGLITKEYTINSNNLPVGFDGLKVVHFSDIHYNRAISLSKIKKIVDEINLINPDIVVFTGDLIDKDSELTEKDYNNLTNLFLKINAKYGKYAVIGNHDFIKDKDKVIDVFNGSNFKYLDNDHEIIYDKDIHTIFIGGLSTISYEQEDLNKTLSYLKEHDDIDYKIVLVHEPDISKQIANDYDIDLILAGQSHNGQIRIPFIGAIYTPPHAKKYYDNYYQIDDTDLYISSGIGVSTINGRLCNRPSINFYRINKEISE